MCYYIITARGTQKSNSERMIKMQILNGTKAEITCMEWDEQIIKAKKRLENSKKCFERFGDSDSAMWVAEDENKLAELIQKKKKAMDFIKKYQIK